MELQEVFNQLNLSAKIVSLKETPSCIFYDVQLGNNLSFERFKSNLNEIQFRLKTNNPISFSQDSGIVKVQIFNKEPENILLENIWKKNLPGFLPIVLGQDYFGNVVTTDISEHPHTLIAGTTGSGKSVANHNFIVNCILRKDVDLYLSDPKQIEFSIYKNHDAVKYIAIDYKATIKMLEKLDGIMNLRLSLLKKYEKNSVKEIPYIKKIVVIIDEISDLMLQDKSGNFKKALLGLAQKCRAAGIYLVISTQRPSAKIISGDIKANFLARIACKVASKIDSKIILDESGAEDLIGKGDAIIKNYDLDFKRFKFCYFDLNMIKNIIK